MQSALKADPNFHKAKIELSRLYIEGWGVEPDYDKAEELLREVLATGREHIALHAYADVNLGKLAFRRRQPDAARNRVRFSELRRKAADKDPEAMREFALMMLGSFEGIEPNPDVAITWLTRAAETGEQNAAMILTLFLSEYETEENKPFQVYVWSTLAIREGVFDLHRLRDQMALRLSDEDWERAKAEVERRFAAFHPEGLN